MEYIVKSTGCFMALRNIFFRRGFLRPFDSTQGKQAQDDITPINTVFCLATKAQRHEGK